MKTKIKNVISAFLKEEDGVTMIEYALLAALIAVALIAALNTLTGDITTLFRDIGTALKGGKS